MYFSKTMIARLIMFALIFASLYTVWRFFDGLRDRYAEYYNLALMQQIWDKEEAKFDTEMKEWKKDFNREFDTENNKEDKKSYPEEKQKNDRYKDYANKSLIKPVPNMPVPAVANEWMGGYLTGLFNFFFRSGFGQAAVAVILISVGLILFVWFWRKTNAILQKIGLEEKMG